MTEIDWSKAPAGANHYEPAATPNNRPVFWRVVDGVAREVWAMNPDGSVRDHFNYGPEGCLAFSPWRCIIKSVEWDGEGLPPPGTQCMVTPHNTLWGFDSLDTRRVQVMSYSADHVWLMELHSDGSGSLSFITTRTDKVDFEPYRSPSVVATEEREKAIAEMWSTYWQPQVSTAMEGLGLLYDAGYRKQVLPCPT